MGWGFFVELELTVPTDAWRELRAARPADQGLEPGWSGLKPRLERELGKDLTRGATFEASLAGWVDPERIFEVEEREDRTHVHLLALLDESNLDQAFPIVALAFAARAHEGAGRLRLVNDGAYVGDKGAVLALEGGAITATPVTDHWAAGAPMREALERRVLGGA